MDDVPPAAGDPTREDSHPKKAVLSPNSEWRRYHVFTHYQWEILSLLFCVGIIAAMYVLLAKYDGKLVNDWWMPLNLTTMLSLLSTALRASLFVPLMAIISQAKWKWFGSTDGRARPLRHLQDIDLGSRSTWGAISLVPLAARASVPALTAVVLSIISLGIGPCVQQAIDTRNCVQTVPGGDAVIPYTHFVSSQRFVSVQMAQYQSEVHAMVYNSLTVAPDLGPGYRCSTGNCTFDNGSPAYSNSGGSSKSQHNGSSVFTTMAMCHKCLDIKDMVSYEEQPHQLIAQLPNGLILKVGDPNIVANIRRFNKFDSLTGNLTWLRDRLDPETSHLAGVALANVTILTAVSVVASTCILYACTRSYAVSVANGRLVEDEVATTPAAEGPVRVQDMSYYPDKDFVVLQSPCWVGDSLYTLTDSNWTCSRGGKTPPVPANECGGKADLEMCIYIQDKKHAIGAIAAMDRSFQVSCDIDHTNFGCYIRGQFGDYSQGQGQGSWAESIFNANVTHAKTEDFFRAFAVSISNRYRAAFGGSQPYFIKSLADRPPPFGEVRGTVLQTSVCNVVRLEWLTFPAVITGLSVVVLLWTMIESWIRRRDRPVWKDSILPFLLYSDRFRRETVGDAASDSSTTVAQESYRDSQGVSLVSSTSPTPTPVGNDGRLLEAGEMEKIASSMKVRFEWPQTDDRFGVEEALRARRRLEVIVIYYYLALSRRRRDDATVMIYWYDLRLRRSTAAAAAHIDTCILAEGSVRLILETKAADQRGKTYN
ncbi:uncharacterized protein PG998_003020 [Apiospora kogelbergensis]|uniref:uncharacterized protein n=1 Tax=Apiospora kogelbergensis TaxID=1337665 RepID=UPI003131D4E7